MSSQTESAKEVFNSLLENCAIVANEGSFKEKYGFTLNDYLSNRTNFSHICRGTANHIQKVVHDTGIANTVGGGLGIASGLAILGGVAAAPFTAGGSLALTVGGIAAGVGAGGTSLTASIVKDSNLKSDMKKIESALGTFEEEEKSVNELFSKILEDKKKLLEMVRADPSIMDEIKKYSKQIATVGYGGYKAVSAVNTIRFAYGIASFIEADVYAMQGIAEGVAAPGLSIFGKTLIVGGTTTAKAFSSALGIFSVGIGIWEIIEGAKDIEGSETADNYRKFADEYDKTTETLKKGIAEIKALSD